MRKKLISTLLCVSMMAFALTGCGNSGSSDSNTGSSTGSSSSSTSTEAPKDDANSGDSSTTSGEPIKVGIINNDPNESGYRTANVNDLKEHFTEANGYKATFAYSKKNEEQIANAKKMIQDGVKYLLLSAADVSGWDSVLKEAQTAGTKVILYDRIIEADENLYEAAVVSDMDKEGQTAVEWLKNQSLDKYEIIHIQGLMGTAAQKGRSGALDEAVKSEGWKMVSQQAGDWSADKAQQIVQSVIDSKESFNVIYAENDDMAKGAVAALDNAGISHGVGKDVIIMGFDCNKWALREVMNKNWNYDGQCNPFQSSYLDDIIKKLEKGEKIAEKVIYLEEKGFDSDSVTEDVIAQSGIGKDAEDAKKE